MKDFPCCQNSASQKEFEEVQSFLKIIADPQRLKILCFLRNGEQCVCDIQEALRIAQNLTSHHLKVLKEFGMVESRQEGRKIFYTSSKSELEKYSRLLFSFLTSSL